MSDMIAVQNIVGELDQHRISAIQSFARLPTKVLGVSLNKYKLITPKVLRFAMACDMLQAGGKAGGRRGWGGGGEGVSAGNSNVRVGSVIICDGGGKGLAQTLALFSVG